MNMIGWISTWGIRCGIATYSRFLVEQMDDVVVMCQSGEGDVEGAIPCWKRDSNFFGGIIAQIAAKGIIFPSKRIEKAVEGLKTCSTVMVHTNADVENLRKLGLTDNVVMIPHGIYPPPSDSAETLPIEGRVMGTFGFLLPHKGQLQLVEAFERLPGWDQLLLLCATRDGTGNTEKKINSIIESKGLKDRVKLVTDFLDDDIAIATLAKCELLVFPYQNTKESASGAVRMGVASGVPIAVSPIPIFDDVSGAIRMRG